MSNIAGGAVSGSIIGLKYGLKGALGAAAVGAAVGAVGEMRYSFVSQILYFYNISPKILFSGWSLQQGGERQLLKKTTTVMKAE
jgi:hypothetical protein